MKNNGFVCIDRCNQLLKTKKDMFRFSYLFFLLAIVQSSASAQADSLVHRFMAFNHVPGMFVGVVRGDSVLYQNSIGLADQGLNIPMSATTCMELGSISKVLTAEAIYNLNFAGILNIRDPIRKYLPQAPISWSGITIQHLLSHSSGISNYLLDPRFMASSYFSNKTEETSEQFFNSINPDAMTQMFYSLPLEFSPGSTWSYSNTGYYLLGKIGEVVSGKPFFELVREEVTAPLQMTQTKANEEAAKEKCLAKGYFLKDTLLVESRVLNSNYAFSAGAWATTGEDMIRYLRAIHGRLLPSDKAGYNWRTQPSDDHELPFTYNGGRFYTTFHGLTIISHNGGTPGFSSSWIYVVEKNTSIIILMNRQDYAPIDQLAWDILSRFEPSLKYPEVKIVGAAEDRMTQDIIAILQAIKTDTPYPVSLSKPLKHFLTSENGKGYWRWFFERGFPTSAKCVDVEKIGDAKLYRFILPLSKETTYHLAVLEDKKGELTQIRWW